MQVCQQLLPGYGEEQILNGLPNEVRAFLSAAIEEEPWFLHEYLLPTLAGLDGADKIIEDLSLALAEIEVEEEIYGVDPEDYEWVGDQNLGFLGKSLKKRLKKVVKKVAAPVKATHKAVTQVAKKIQAPLKEVTKKAGAAIQKAGTRVGRAVHRAAKSGKLQIALAPFTAGVSLAFHPKVGRAGKKFMAGPYGNVVIGALGAIFALPTGGASVAAAAALTTANTMYQKKKAAEAAKKAAKANANQLAAEANQLQSQAEQQLNDFYTQNAQYFQQYGVTQSMWSGMSFDEKVALLDAAAAGTLPVRGQPSPGPSAPSAGHAPSPGGGYAPPAPDEGGEGGGYAPPAPSGGGGGGGGYPSGGGSSGGGAPASAGQQPGVSRAGMGELFMPAAIGIGILAVMMQSKKKGRARRNPGRRRTRWSA